MLNIERLPAAGSNKEVLLYKRGGGGKYIKASAKMGNAFRDEEEGRDNTQVREKPGRVSGKSQKDVHAVET